MIYFDNLDDAIAFCNSHSTGNSVHSKCNGVYNAGCDGHNFYPTYGRPAPDNYYGACSWVIKLYSKILINMKRDLN